MPVLWQRRRLKALMKPQQVLVALQEEAVSVQLLISPYVNRMLWNQQCWQILWSSKMNRGHPQF